MSSSPSLRMTLPGSRTCTGSRSWMRVRTRRNRPCRRPASRKACSSGRQTGARLQPWHLGLSTNGAGARSLDATETACSLYASVFSTSSSSNSTSTLRLELANQRTPRLLSNPFARNSKLWAHTWTRSGSQAFVPSTSGRRPRLKSTGTASLPSVSRRSILAIKPSSSLPSVTLVRVWGSSSPPEVEGRSTRRCVRLPSRVYAFSCHSFATHSR